MADIPARDVLNPDAPIPLPGVVRPVLEAYCEWWIGQGQPLTVDVSQRALHEFYCRPPDAPPLPQQPPTTYGGQCCELYDLTATIEQVGAIAQPPTTFTATLLPGRLILENNITRSVSDPDLFDREIIVRTGINCPGVEPGLISLGGGTNLGGAAGNDVVLRGYSITRSDGSLDACGVFHRPPPVTPPIPPPYRDRIDVNIDGIDVSVDVFAPIINIPIDVNVRPEFNIQLPDLNLNFNFDGINISFPGGGNGDNPPRQPPIPEGEEPDGTPTTPPLSPDQPGGGGGGGGTGGGDCPDVNLQPVLRAIDEVQEDVDDALIKLDLLLDCDRCTRPQPEECDKQLIGTGQGAEIELAPGAEWVGVEIIDKPQNAKGYFSVNSADVLFAGWHEFGSLSAEGVRTPIQYDVNVYPVLEGASKFSFCLQTGFTASYYVYFNRDTN